MSGPVNNPNPCVQWDSSGLGLDEIESAAIEDNNHTSRRTASPIYEGNGTEELDISWDHSETGLDDIQLEQSGNRTSRGPARSFYEGEGWTPEEGRLLPGSSGGSQFEDTAVAMVSVARAALLPNGEAARFFVGSPGQSVSYSEVGFICQADTTLMECRMQANHLYSLGNTPIDTIFNPEMTAFGARSILPSDPRIRLLREGWDDFFRKNPRNRLCRMQLCAGDATYIVRAALQGYQCADRIIVIAMAPSCIIPEGSCAMVRYYRSSADIFSIRCVGSPVMEIASRSDNSRGWFDQGAHSSTYQEILRMELLCFNIRQRYLEMRRSVAYLDQRWQELRVRFVEDRDDVRAPALLQSRRDSRRRLLLEEFLMEFGGEAVVTALSNLYEEAADEFPADGVERGLVCLDLGREFSLIATALMVGLLGNVAVGIAPGVAVFLEGLNLLRRAGPFVVRRTLDGGSFWRMAGMQWQFIEVGTWIAEGGLLGGFISVASVPAPIISALGIQFGVRGANLFLKALVELCPTLRRRLQRFFVDWEEETGDIHTQRTENRSAERLGLIQRIQRSLIHISYGLGTAAISGVLLYPLLFHSEEEQHSSGNATVHASSPERNTEMVLLGITGLLAAGSVVSEMFQFRRTVRRLQNRLLPGATVIEIEHVSSSPLGLDDDSRERYPNRDEDTEGD